MKLPLIPLILIVFLAAGCMHSPPPSFPPTPPAESSQNQPAVKESLPQPSMDRVVASGNAQQEDRLPGPEESPVKKADSGEQLAPQETPPGPGNKALDNEESLDYVEEKGTEEEKIDIADPLEPFNRAMFHFNDKLYFWVLKPLGRGYGKVVPEGARVSVSNFFSNITFPIRFVNCLLQAKVRGAATELGRFIINTTLGIGGFFDPASGKRFDLRKQNVDLGQTLGIYGLGQGFFITWPIFGPSSPRDTVGMIGDAFLDPINYLQPWEASTGVKAYDKVNGVSLRIGDYEALKEAAIDPYVAIRNAYAQHRQNKVKQREKNNGPVKPVSLRRAPAEEASLP